MPKAPPAHFLDQCVLILSSALAADKEVFAVTIDAFISLRCARGAYQRAAAWLQHVGSGVGRDMLQRDLEDCGTAYAYPQRYRALHCYIRLHCL